MKEVLNFLLSVVTLGLSSYLGARKYRKFKGCKYGCEPCPYKDRCKNATPPTAEPTTQEEVYA